MRRFIIFIDVVYELYVKLVFIIVVLLRELFVFKVEIWELLKVVGRSSEVLDDSLVEDVMSYMMDDLEYNVE